MAQTKSKVNPIPRVTRAGARKAAQEEATVAAQEEESKQQSEQESDDEKPSISASDSGEDEEGSMDEDGMYDTIYVGGRSSSQVNVSSNDEGEFEIMLSVEEAVEVIPMSMLYLSICCYLFSSFFFHFHDTNCAPSFTVQEKVDVSSDVQDEIQGLQGGVAQLEKFDCSEC